MNLFELQERLKDFSQDQLVREMQAPTGTAPQYLVLSELQRRQRMMREQQAQMPQDQTTVAQDAVAAAGVPQGGLADMAQAMAPRTDMDMNTGVAPVERMRDGGVVRMQPGGLAGISRDLDVYSPTMGGARLIPERMMEEEDARRRRAELAAAMFQYESDRMPVPTGEGQLFDFDTSPLLPQEIAPEAGAPPVGTDLRGLGTVVGELISGEDPEAAATRLLESGQIDEEQYNRYVFGSSGERESVVREALDLDPRRDFPDAADVTDTEEAATAEEVVNLPELVIDSEPGLSFGDQFPPVDVRRASDEVLGFGDITPTGAEIPLALPRGAEEKEPPAPRTGGGGGAAVPAGDDAFNQDKWLALAQAGLSLMSSQQPTIGGAIGEAGLAGITALRTARGERDERVAAQQARADRLAAAAARAERDTISGTERAAYFRAANEATAEADALELALARGGVADDLGMVTPYTEEELAILRRQLNDAKSRANIYSGISNPSLANIQATLE
jgi:hypothetical protein